MRRVMRGIRLLTVGATVAASAGLAAACGAGHGNVYVGVGVVGPYGMYPGYYPPPTMIGRPPVYWEEEEEEEEDVDDDEEDGADTQDVFDARDGAS